jgi:HlyD family secretion protein
MVKRFITNLVTITFFSVILISCKQQQETVLPQVKPLIEAVYASGFVVAKNEYQLFSQAEGYLAEKLVHDGDLVKKGDPLFIIEGNQQSARFTIARENYAMAVRNYGDDSPVLRELIAARDAAYKKFQFDSLNFVRYTNLLESNATARAEYDRMKLAYENSANEYALQRSRLERMRNQLYLELQNARHQLQIASDESGRYVVRSDIDGKVFRTMKERGELVRRYEAVAIIGNDNSFYLQLQVDELDINRVKAGQEIVVKIDAYPGKLFRSTVDKVYPMINQQQQSVRVDATLQDPLPGVFSGLAVEANIIIRQKEKALVVPKSALLNGDSLRIRTGSEETFVKVRRGLETFDEVEIVEGLSGNEEVIVNR